MPQPFNGKWIGDPDACAKRPELAAYIGRIAAHWSHVEWSMGILVSVILHEDARLATTVFSPVRSEPTRFAILDAIATENLPPELFQEFQALRKQVKQTGGERDRIIHGCWMLAPEAPDSLIHINPRQLIDNYAAYATVRAKGLGSAPLKDMQKLDEFRFTPLEYTMRDFQEVERRIKERISDIDAFSVKVRQFHERPASPPLASTPPQAGH